MAGWEMKNRKSQVFVRYTENSGAVRRNILIVMRWRDGGTGLEQWLDCGTGLKLWRDAGLNNSSGWTIIIPLRE